jgi:8-oxo-dGTP pyrophosphatase MutT (NUDIX family)
MELLLEIRDEDVYPSPVKHTGDYNLRTAVRAVLFNEEGKISLQYVSKHNYHKIPGGGAEGGETIEQSLRREVLEEAGCEIEIGESIGKIIEYRNKINQLQTNYCFLTEIKGEPKEPNYDTEEIEDEFVPIWVSIDEAIKLLENDKPSTYDSAFIIKRDLVFLQKAKELKLGKL